MAKSKDAFRTIREVSEWLDTPAHVLRFWESKFTQVKPVKRAGGRRYYRPADMLLLGGIKKLLHDDGMTIRGVQKMLREQGVKHVAALSQELDDDAIATVDIPADPLPDEAPMAVDVPTLPAVSQDTDAETGEVDNVVPLSRRERRLASNRRRVAEKEDARQADLFGGFDTDPTPAVPQETALEMQPAQESPETAPAPVDGAVDPTGVESPEPVAPVDTAPTETTESDPESVDEVPAESPETPAEPAVDAVVFGADLPAGDRPLSDYAARDTVASALISRSTRRALMRKHPEKLAEILPRLTALAERMGAETKG